MPQTENLVGQGQKARVYPRQAGLYPTLNRDLWYRVRPGGSEENGWCWLQVGDSATIQQERPDFWRKFRKSKWKKLANDQLVSPSLSNCV